jgi:tripartite-type tricarboxylate transporter receptor subunit TctC
MASVLAQPDTQEYLIKQGSEAFITPNPDDVTALIKSDVARYAKIIKDAGIRTE